MTVTVTEPSRILDRAAEQVRAFNHASISSGPDWQYPSHSYDALGNLAYLLRMLPQAIEQAVYPAVRAQDAGRLRIDGGGDPGEAMQRLRVALTDAVTNAEALAAAVDRMHSAASPMAYAEGGA